VRAERAVSGCWAEGDGGPGGGAVQVAKWPRGRCRWQRGRGGGGASGRDRDRCGHGKNQCKCFECREERADGGNTAGQKADETEEQGDAGVWRKAEAEAAGERTEDGAL